MIEAILNALDFERIAALIGLLTIIPIGIYLHIESCGGWTLYWAEKRKERK
jgi:hypothetical protein